MWLVLLSLSPLLYVPARQWWGGTWALLTLLPTVLFIPVGVLAGAAAEILATPGPEPWLVRGTSRWVYAVGYCSGVAVMAYLCLVNWRYARKRKGPTQSGEAQ